MTAPLRSPTRRSPSPADGTPPLRTVAQLDDPLVATAIHAGHAVRREVADLLILAEPDRLREEDPLTDRWTVVAGNRLLPQRSRFEVDLNRPRDRAVYAQPADAWGLDLWREPLPRAVVERSLGIYDAFYAELFSVCEALRARHGAFVVLDLHSYNHRRTGPGGPDDDPAANPEVNIGTGSMDRQRWGPLVDRFMADLAAADFLGRHLDVRENVRFRGGHLSQWVHATFPTSGCTLAIECKKIFMDEWTGEPFEEVVDAILGCLQATVPGLRESLAAARGAA
jgi:N-formylglutamate deformylase